MRSALPTLAVTALIAALGVAPLAAAPAAAARLPLTVVAKGTLAATGAQAPLGVLLLGALLLVGGGIAWSVRRPRGARR